MLKPALQDDARAAVEDWRRHRDGGPAVLIGAPWVEEGKLYNAVLLLDGGKIAGRTFKDDLPNYGVFDEKRVFAAGPAARAVERRGVRWACRSARTSGRQDACDCLAETGAEILLVPNGSPFEAGKEDVRAEAGRGAGARNRLAADLSQPGGRPGRAGVRRRQSSSSMPIARSPGAAGAGENTSSSPNGARRGRQMGLRAGRTRRARRPRQSRSITP